MNFVKARKINLLELQLKPIALALSGVAWSLCSGAASAQSNGVGPLEEVIVTAQKRAQSLQEVPLAISAFSGESLRDMGIHDASQVVAAVPGVLSVSTGNNSFADQFVIRGISTSDFGVGGDPSIALYKNGVYAGRSGEVLGSFFDLERVEVLRGPQGLLFGRSAASGVIHQITRRADTEAFEGEFGLGGGERGQLRGDAVLNMPISDSFAVRLAYTHSEEDGYVKDTQDADDYVWHDRDAIRLTMGYNKDALDVQAMVEYEDREQTPALYSALDENAKPVTGDLYLTGSNMSDEMEDHAKIANFTLNISYDFVSTTLTSITGYRDYDWDYREDADGSELPLADYQQLQTGDYFSQEMRLVSAADGNSEWFVGASGYYDSVEGDFTLKAGENAVCQTFVGLPCDAFLPGFEETADGVVEHGTGDSESVGAAIYADYTYHFNEEFALSAGLRYSYDKREFTLTSDPVENDLTDIFGRLGFIYAYETVTPVKSEESWDYLSPRLLLEYTPTDDWMAFASVTQGFKPGAFDTFGVTPVIPGFPSATAAPNAEVDSVDEETILSYELGTKGTFFDNRAQLSLSAYYYDYQDLQAYITRGVSVAIENVGEATGYGLEGEFLIKPSEHWDFRLNAAWAKTEIEEINPTTCTEPDGSSCVGNELPGSPKLTAFGALNFYLPLGEVETYFTSEVSYNDGYESNLENNELTRIDSFTVVNFRVGAHIGESWQLSAYLTNAFDEAYYGEKRDQQAVGLLYGGGAPSRPRTWGADIRYRF